MWLRRSPALRSEVWVIHAFSEWERDPLLFQKQERKNALGTVAFHIQGRASSWRTAACLLALSPHRDFERGCPISLPTIRSTNRFDCLLFFPVAVALQDLTPNQIRKFTQVSKSKWCGLEYPLTPPGRMSSCPWQQSNQLLFTEPQGQVLHHTLLCKILNTFSVSTQAEWKK